MGLILILSRTWEPCNSTRRKTNRRLHWFQITLRPLYESSSRVHEISTWKFFWLVTWRITIPIRHESLNDVIYCNIWSCTSKNFWSTFYFLQDNFNHSCSLSSSRRSMQQKEVLGWQGLWNGIFLRKQKLRFSAIKQ